MVEWWQSSPSPLFLTSKDCLIETCWETTPQTALSSFCIFSVLCRFDKTSRRFLALPLHELPPSRLVDFLVPRPHLGSFLEGKQNSLFPDHILQTFTSDRQGIWPHSSFGLFLSCGYEQNDMRMALANGIVLLGTDDVSNKWTHWLDLGDFYVTTNIFLVSLKYFNGLNKPVYVPCTIEADCP